MNKHVAASQCETLAEWADHWERSCSYIPGAEEASFLLRRSALKIMELTGCGGPAIKIPRAEMLFANHEAEFRGEDEAGG